MRKVEVIVEDEYNALVGGSGKKTLFSAGNTAPDGPIVIAKDLDPADNGVPGLICRKGLGGYIPESDISRTLGADTTGVLVKRLVQAGFSVLGDYSVCPPFGMDTDTQGVTNSFDARRSPAGSSGGAASIGRSGLVVDGVLRAAIPIGSDYGGSIRGPAAVHGDWAIKPTGLAIIDATSTDFERGIASHGVITGDPTMDASILDILKSNDEASMPSSFKFNNSEVGAVSSVAVAASLCSRDSDISGVNKQAMSEAIRRLRARGVKISDLEHPFSSAREQEIQLAYSHSACYATHLTISSLMNEGVDVSGLPDWYKLLSDIGEGYEHAATEGVQTLLKAQSDMDEWFNRKGAPTAVLTPTLHKSKAKGNPNNMSVMKPYEEKLLKSVSELPERVREFILKQIFRSSFPKPSWANVTGLPAATYNILDLGVGVQLMGSRWSDPVLINTAKMLHTQAPVRV